MVQGYATPNGSTQTFKPADSGHSRRLKGKCINRGHCVKYWNTSRSSGILGWPNRKQGEIHIRRRGGGFLIDQTVMEAILESIKDPLLFVDTDHVTRYMNRAAIEHFDDGEALIGRSVMDCHNERSCEIIRKTLTALQAGEDERLIATTDKNRIYMRAVRSPDGCVIGYYERYEPIGG